MLLVRRRCREFLEGGWGAIDWIDLYGQKQLNNKNPAITDGAKC